MNVRLVHTVDVESKFEQKRGLGRRHDVEASRGLEITNRVGARSVSDKERLIATLREMLQDSFRLRNEGSAYAKLTHSQGSVDGYMRALTLSGVVDDRELLQIIAEERRGAHGPATRRIDLDLLGEEVAL